MKRSLSLALVLALLCSLVLLATVQALAGSAENTFAGKILLLDQRPPASFKSGDAFIGFLRKHVMKSTFQNEQATWSFETMAFFKQPLGDYEIEMVFYDTETGKTKDTRRFVNAFTQYTQDRETRALAGKITLVRPSFDANKRYQIVAQSRGKELAYGEFETKGVSQAQLDQQKRLETEMKKMEESMRDLERKAKEQQERQQKQGKEAGDKLF